MNFKTVPLGSQSVQVMAGGYYDRYRMNPSLDEIARDLAGTDVNWFRRYPKEMVPSRMGPMWTPNYYYRVSSVQLVFLAPLGRLRPALPHGLEPLSPLPGKGLVALSLFSYAQCDNDAYNEAAIAVVVRRPGSRDSQMQQLVEATRRRVNYAHVLALPVTTDIARMRGVIGYQLPKWLAKIDLSTDGRIQAGVSDMDGREDLRLSAPSLRWHDVRPQSRLGAVHMIHSVDGVWHETIVESNTLSYGEAVLPRGVRLRRSGGPLSQLLDGLGASTLLRIEVMREGQLILHLPRRSQSMNEITIQPELRLAAGRDDVSLRTAASQR